MEVVRPLPPIIFEGRNWPLQTINHWKGNLMASRVHLKCWKNILILRLYERFSQNDSAMAPEKIFKLSNMNILYIALKHVIWRFRICIIQISRFYEHFNKFREICFCSYFCEIQIFRETIYINGISRSCALKWYIICSYFKSLRFFPGVIEESFRENCS